MSNHTYRVIEIVGTSPTASTRQSRAVGPKLRKPCALDWFEGQSIRATLVDRRSPGDYESRLPPGGFLNFKRGR